MYATVAPTAAYSSGRMLKTDVDRPNRHSFSTFHCNGMAAAIEGNSGEVLSQFATRADQDRGVPTEKKGHVPLAACVVILVFGKCFYFNGLGFGWDCGSDSWGLCDLSKNILFVL